MTDGDQSNYMETRFEARQCYTKIYGGRALRTKTQGCSFGLNLISRFSGRKLKALFIRVVNGADWLAAYGLDI